MPFIADKTIRKPIIDSLRAMGEEVLFSADCKNVYSPVNTHPDLQIHFVSSDTAFVPPILYEYYKSILPANIKLYKGNKNPGDTYPYNIAYNISRLGDRAVLNLKYADEEIVRYYQDNGIRLINVKQGYAKCNISSWRGVALTEDEGIYKALTQDGVKTLKIPVGGVSLKGFPYGFIGGASGEYKDKILFCGKMKNPNVIKFFKENGVLVRSLDDNILTDYGSIIYFE